jgi:hypothetical protein
MSKSIGSSHPTKTSKNWNSKTKFNKTIIFQDSPCRVKPFTPDHNLRTNNYATFAQPKYYELWTHELPDDDQLMSETCRSAFKCF